MKWFTLDEVVFSLKCYLSAMLALYVAYSIGLPRPFWSMLTAYVVVVPHPWAGAIRSKALFRLCGTALGSAATVYMVPRLSLYPVLMTGAMALWVGGCLYLALLDRTPRAYVFMLAGYTAALIGFPSVTDPGAIFDTAIARVEEIGLGIVCGALVHSLVLPSGIQPVIMRQLDAAISNARAWLHDMLLNRSQSKSETDRRLLAGDITSLRILSAHIPYEAGSIRWTAQAISSVQDNLVAIAPLVSAVGDRLRALQADGGELPPAIRALLEEIWLWIEAGDKAPAGKGVALRAAIRELAPEIGMGAGWNDMLLLSLLMRLRGLVIAHERGLKLRALVDKGLKGMPIRQRGRKTRRSDLHLDKGIALWSGFSAVICIALCCTFWIMTGWTNGGTAAMMAAVFMSFFATTDNPVPFIRQFLNYTVLSIPVSALYLLGILPAIHSFEMLALTIFPMAFFLGLFLQRPAVSLKAMAFLFGVVGTLALQDTHASDLVSFIDGMLAQIFGIAAAAVVSAVIRTVSVSQSVRRIQKANLRDLADLAQRPGSAKSRTFDLRMLDRVGLLQAKLATTTVREGEQAADALKELRIGSDIAALQSVRRQSPMAAAILRPALAEIASYFGRRSIEGECDADPHFLEQIDRALAAASRSVSLQASRIEIIVALVGIRRGIFPDAPAYQPSAAGLAA